MIFFFFLWISASKWKRYRCQA